MYSYPGMIPSLPGPFFIPGMPTNFNYYWNEKFYTNENNGSFHEVKKEMTDQD